METLEAGGTISTVEGTAQGGPYTCTTALR